MSLESDRRAQIGLRYGPKDMDQYHRVRKIAEEVKESLSSTGKLLIAKGIQHKDNPEPLIKTVVKEVPVEKIVKVPVYRDPPKVDKSTPHIQEHITDEHIGGSDTEQRPSAGKLTTRDKADPPSDTALDEKKPATGNGSLGWALGGIGLAGLIIYFVRKYIS